jgi:hypothetical protein
MRWLGTTPGPSPLVALNVPSTLLLLDVRLSLNPIGVCDLVQTEGPGWLVYEKWV